MNRGASIGKCTGIKFTGSVMEEYDGYTALHYSYEEGNDVFIEMLIRYGADVKSIDN